MRAKPLACYVGCALVFASAAATTRANWDRHVQVSWTDAPLARLLESAAGQQGVWFRDRRVDPNIRITHRDSGPLQAVLDRGLASHGYGAAKVGELLYVGPDVAARGLAATLADSRRQLARNRTRLRFLQRRDALAWPRLTVPGNLIASVVDAAPRGPRLPDARVVPHDVWDAGSLPAMPLGDQLTLLLYGFDLAWRYDPSSNAIRLTRIEHNVAPPATTAHQAAAPEDAAFLDRRLTLTVRQQPLRTVLRSLAEPLGLGIEIAVSEALMNQRISVSSVDAPLDTLLATIAERAGVTIRREAATLYVETPPR